jgi:transcription elongation GreA/GreB family factor
MTIKQKLYNLCREYIDRRITSTRLAIHNAQQAANEETRSSSGDKYETGRAMAQLEIEKNTQQLAEALKLKTTLEQIPIDFTHQAAQPGSLVITDRGSFFIAIGLGKVELDGESYFVIATFSPLGLALAGSRAGERVSFRDQTYHIQELI